MSTLPEEQFSPSEYWEQAYEKDIPDTCSRCNICHINKPLFGLGNPEAEVAVVAEALGKTEVEKRQPLIGRAGQIFNRALKEAGLERQDLWITNTVAGNPVDPKTGKNRTPSSFEINSCFPHVLEELKRLPNLKVVLVLGRVPLEAFLQKHIDTLKDVVGQEIELSSGLVIVPSYHPASVLYDGGKRNYAEILYALRVIKNLEKEDELDYKTITTLGEFNDFYRELSTAKYCSVDIETTGLNIYEPDFGILGISISLRKRHGVYIPLNTAPELELFGKTLQPYWKSVYEKHIIECLKEILEDRDIIKIGQGFMFDYQCLKHKYDIESYWHYDTLHLEKQVDETARAALEVLIKKYCPELLEVKRLIKKKAGGKVDENSFRNMPLDILAEYACGDTDATLRVFLKQWSILKAEHKRDKAGIMKDVLPTT